MSVLSSDTDDIEEVLFHMAQRELYESVSASGEAHSPPTFEADGMFTNATAVHTRIITTTNHFYNGTKGYYICLQLSRSALHKLGIVTKFRNLNIWGKQRWEKLGIGFALIFLVVFLPDFLGLSQVCMKLNRMQRDIFLLFLV